MKFISGGFSHGECYTGILEGLPAGLFIDENFINQALKLRQEGVGRSPRQRIEDDKIQILSGIINGLTVGAPLVFCVANKSRERISFTVARPGHADLSGGVKYGFDDLSLVAERASGRSTVTTVAAGAVCSLFLDKLGIAVKGRALSIGATDYGDKNAVINLIKTLIKNRDSVGGLGEVRASGIIPGIGGYSQTSARLDGKLAGAVMSIPSVKAVEFGLGRGFECSLGSNVADHIYINKGSIKRTSNNSGGIDGGMTNGEEVVIRFTVKPIPTLAKGAQSIDMITMKGASSPALRSDVCVVESISTVAEAVVAYELLDEVLSIFGGDTAAEVIERYNKKKEKISDIIKKQEA